jgi:hypothetical protein
LYKANSPEKQTDETWVGPSNPDIIRCGQEALSRLCQGQSWDDWLAVGEALRIIRHLAMLEAHTNEPEGSRYQTVFGERLRNKGFGEIDKGDRKRLFDCLEHHAEIKAWRATLPINKRLALNHPSSVWRAWQKSTVAGKTTVAVRPSPIAKYKDEVARLEEENIQLRGAGDDLFTTTDTAIDIARLLATRLVRLTPSKAEQILKLLPELYAKCSSETPYDKARPRSRKKRPPTIEDFQRKLAAKKAAEARHA